MRLQIPESLRGAELRIILGNGEQSAQCAAQSALRRFKLAQAGGVFQIVHGQSDGCRLGPRLRHRLECFLLEVGGAAYGADQIGNQVRASLVLRFDIRPGLFDQFFPLDHSIVCVASHAPAEKHNEKNKKEGNRSVAAHRTAN